MLTRRWEVDWVHKSAIRNLPKRLPRITAVMALGLALLLAVMALAGCWEFGSTSALTKNTLETLKQQCINYDKLLAADRTKSLFRLADLLTDLSYHLQEQPELATDTFLEEHVDRLRISGIALLDENLKLDASGYTRQYRNPQWKYSENGTRFADIVDYPNKIYAHRVQMGGNDYDICAVSRKDKKGILVGFYRQPAGMLSGTENDLASLLGGLYLQKQGAYAISWEDTVWATSDSQMESGTLPENPVLRRLSQLPSDGQLRPFHVNGSAYLGCRSGCNGYVLYIYYPILAAFPNTWLAAALFAMAYFVTWAGVYATRNRVLSDNQKALQESNRQLSEKVNMLRSLETIYFTLFYVDLPEDRYESIYLAPWLTDKVPAKGSYQELKRYFMEHTVLPQFREELDGRLSPEFIRETLSMENITDVHKSFYTDYQAYRGGEEKWCRVSVTVADFDQDGKPSHVLILLQDVSREKTKEAAYQRRIVEEAQEARVANSAKTDFLRRISHDIRTPINGIQGYLNMAARYPGDMQIQEECRERAMEAMNALMSLVNSVLDMSKLESSEIKLEEKPFDLMVVLNETTTLIRPRATDRGIEYKVLRRDCLPISRLVGSPRHVMQVLMNLAGNAVKYGKPGGYVHLNTRLVSSTPTTATFEFTCEDNGLGMSQEFQQHMYEPFSQEAQGARTTYEGSGLGLSIVKKLVDALGGTIQCHSEKGKGTTFRVELTFQIDRSYTAQQTDSGITGEKKLRGVRVLLVEDNHLNMDVAEFLLTTQGAEVSKAWNGKEAVETFSASPAGYFHLILMDIMMPVMDGLEASRAIRSLAREDARTVPIAAMSANTFSDDVRRSLDAGMNAHIPKPVDEATLLAVARQLLGTQP